MNNYTEIKIILTPIFHLKRILDAIGAPYETFNILEDNDIRSGMKVFQYS
jgi:hypothetical protein